MVIIDYNVGNLSSIQNMLKRIGVKAVISRDCSIISRAEKLILPGVGSFDYGMNQLNQSGLIDILNKRVLEDKVPLLGICLGAQLLTEQSEEGKVKGLGWIKGKTVSFDRARLHDGLKIPHMGWAEVSNYENSKLFSGIQETPRFYFVHSYHLLLENPDDELLHVNYGYTFAGGIEHQNILGVQFHPEKSHKFGMKVFENFINYY